MVLRLHSVITTQEGRGKTIKISRVAGQALFKQTPKG